MKCKKSFDFIIKMSFTYLNIRKIEIFVLLDCSFEVLMSQCGAGVRSETVVVCQKGVE